MKDFAAEFQANQYQELVRGLMLDTINMLIEQDDKIAEKCIADIEKTIKHVTEMQAVGMAPVVNIVISLLYTSVYFGKPQLRVDFYHEPWVFGDAFYTEYIDAAWLFTHWQSHRTATEEAVKNKRAWIRTTHLDSICQQSVSMLGYLAVTRLKYWIQDLKQSTVFHKLHIGSEFYIFFGEYMDWQKPIFGVLPEIDIFNCKTEDSLRFRQFEHCRYSKKQFSELDLSSSLFRDSTFEHCDFANVDLSDTVFENCHFLDTSFSETIIPGALFSNTILRQVNFVNVIADPVGADYEKQDMYRNLDFNSCMLENIKLKDCRFKGAFLTDCVVKGTCIEGGDYTSSDFAEFINVQTTRQEEA